MLYQEADRGPAAATPAHPGHVLARHPTPPAFAFGPSMGRVGYDHRMEVGTQWKGSRPEGEGG
jgi:hypothetical protein